MCFINFKNPNFVRGQESPTVDRQRQKTDSYPPDINLISSQAWSRDVTSNTYSASNSDHDQCNRLDHSWSWCVRPVSYTDPQEPAAAAQYTASCNGTTPWAMRDVSATPCWIPNSVPEGAEDAQEHNQHHPRDSKILPAQAPSQPTDHHPATEPHNRAGGPPFSSSKAGSQTNCM